MKIKNFFSIFLVFLTIAAALPAKAETWQARIKSLAGKNGAVLAADASGRALFEWQADRLMVPASTFKIVIAAAALDALGPDYRFTTDFRLAENDDLYVAGHGDPFLVSEELAFIAGHLKSAGLARVRDIRVDNSFFAPGLVFDGTNRSLNPYDAYNGALCVNFNTIYANISRSGDIQSAEPQTPMTDLGRELARKSSQRGKVRFNLADNPRVCLQYAGDLIRAFLEQAGIQVTGKVAVPRQATDHIPLIYRHESRKKLTGLLEDLLEYSNNFMTNQIFLAAGAERFGPPATAEKARRVVLEYLKKKGIPPFHVEEGSGLSRKNRISARQMTGVLREFLPDRTLLPLENGVHVKTGTLSDVRSLAGYIERSDGGPVLFTIFLNGGGIRSKAREEILDLLKENLD